MNTQVKWITVIGAAVLVGTLLVGGVAVTTTLAQGPAPWRSWGGYGPGGMMGGWGGMMGGMMGGGMMGGYGAMDPQGCPGGGWGNPGTGTPLTNDEAAARAQDYVDSLGDPDLVLTEVMEFTNNFYVQVEEESTGVHAFELLINRYTGAVYPEMGPNMMWNTKYSPMAGMMGGWWGQPSGPATVTPEQARTYAQQFLDAYLPGTSVDEEADAFYGYYTIHVLRDGQIVGMLSVNGYSGQVWYHTWHGDFINMRMLEG